MTTQILQNSNQINPIYIRRLLYASAIRKSAIQQIQRVPNCYLINLDTR